MDLQCVVLKLCLLASAAYGHDTLREISWSDVSMGIGLQDERITIAEDASRGESISIRHTVDTPTTITLLVLDNPGITAAAYALQGEIRCTDVQGMAYLEMLSHFPGGTYPTRGLDQSGQLQSLVGTSDWRSFHLPFVIPPQNEIRPHRLTLNLVMPGPGTVHISPLRLARHENGQAFTMKAGGWWSNRDAGLYGGIGGALIGCLGAAIGILAGKVRARRVVKALFAVMFGAGVVALATGVVALLLSQPFHVFYPLLLVGVLCVLLPACLFRNVQRRYAQLELRKMEAMDVP